MPDLRDLYVGEDKEGKFYGVPEPTRYIAGYPIIGGFLLVTPRGKAPLFTPITQERAQRWIRQPEAAGGGRRRDPGVCP